MLSSIKCNSSFLTSKNAMEILGVSIVTLRKWAKDGTINTIRTSGNHRLYDVKSYLRDCETQKESRKVNDINNDNNNDNNNVKNNDVKNILRKSINTSYSKIKKEIEGNNDSSSMSSDDDNNLDEDVDDKDVGENIKNKQKKFCYICLSSQDQKNDFDKNLLFLQKKYKNYTIIEDNGPSTDLKRPGLMKIINLALDKKIENLVILSKDNLSSNNYELLEYIIKKHSKSKIINENKFETVSTTSALDKIINIIDNYKSNLVK